MRSTLLIAFAILVWASCDEETLSLNGRWKLAHYYNAQTGTVDGRMVQVERPIVLTFSGDGRAGTIHTDSIGGPMLGIYEIGNRSRFTFTSLGSPYSRDEWSTMLLQSIANADFVKISDNSLNISCNQGREVLLFVRDN